jgi:hypothetical protein
MPIVTAAGYRTLDAPSVEPSPTPGPDYQQISGITPNAFGAQVGQAQSALGNQFDRTGNVFEQNALEQQRLTNQVAVDNATNHAMMEANKILYGDPDKPGDVGYYGMKGIDAVNNRQATMKRLTDLVDQTRSASLNNPRQQIEFDNRTQRMRSFWLGEIGRHYDQQLTQSAINSAKAGQALAGQGMAATAANGDETGFSLSVQRYMEAANSEANASGWTQTQLDAEYAKIRGMATSVWVESKAVSDPAGAKAFLEHNKDSLLPHEQHRLEQMIKTHADNAIADSFVNNLQGRGGGGGLVRGGAIQGRISDPRGLVPFIRETAQKYGINPDTAVAVAHSEGLGFFLGDNGQSGGAFQLYTGGGMGNEFQRDTGLNPLDPANEKATIDYALRRAAKEGWGAWHGARRIGITGFAGINGQVQTQPAASTATPLPDTERTRQNWEYFKTQGGGVSKNVTYEQYRTMFGNPGLGTVQPGAPDTVQTEGNVPAVPAVQTALTGTPSTPANRTGMMPLDQQFDAIANSNMTPEQKEHAYSRATQRFNALEAAAARAHRLQDEANKQAVQDYTNKVIADVYSPNPQITPTMISTDPALKSDPLRREQLIKFINDPPGSSVPAHQSGALAMSLIERMQPTYTGSDKITETGQLLDAMHGRVNYNDFKHVKDVFEQQQQLSGSTINHEKARLLDTVKSSVVGLIQDHRLNQEGYMNFLRYEQFVGAEIKRAQEKGQNPHELLTVGSPKFLGTKEILKGFQLSPDKMHHDINDTTDLTTLSNDELLSASQQGKVKYDAALAEVKRRIKAGTIAPQPSVPLR